VEEEFCELRMQDLAYSRAHVPRMPLSPGPTP
jgi:hypothetical protein